MKTPKSIVMLGDSLSVGYGASQPQDASIWQFIQMVRDAYPGSLTHPIGLFEAFGPSLGAIYRSWTDGGIGNLRPDVVIVENSIVSHGVLHVGPLAQSIGPSATSIKMTHNPKSSGNFYRLYGEGDDGLVEEWILSRASSTVTATRCKRGMLGTRATSWPSGVDVGEDSSIAAGTEWPVVLRAILDQITGDPTYRPIVLVTDEWYPTTAADTAALKAFVNGYEYDRIGFVEYVRDDGTRIKEDGVTTGGTPITWWATDGSPSTGIGGTAINSTSKTFQSTEATFSTTVGLSVGDLVLISNSDASPAAATSEICKVASITGYGSLTLTRSDGSIVFGGSTAKAFNHLAGKLWKLAGAQLNGWSKYQTMGAAAFSSGDWQDSTHPNSLGYRLIAEETFRVYEDVIGNIY